MGGLKKWLLIIRILRWGKDFVLKPNEKCNMRKGPSTRQRKVESKGEKQGKKKSHPYGQLFLSDVLLTDSIRKESSYSRLHRADLLAGYTIQGLSHFAEVGIQWY